MVSMFNLLNPVFARPPPSSSTVYLGTDKTFTTADRGDTGWSKWGIAPYYVEHGYRFSYKEATAFTMSSIAFLGWGGCESWAWVGKYFYTTGGGSATANIRMEGHIYGYLGVAGAASTSVKVELWVKDINTGTTWTTTIKEKSFGGPYVSYWINEDFNKAKTVVLQSYRYYYVYVKVTCKSSVSAVGTAVSDFEYRDAGYPNGYVRYNKIIIDF